MPYYRALWEEWDAETPASEDDLPTWEEISEAVFEEGMTGGQVDIPAPPGSMFGHWMTVDEWNKRRSE